MRRHLKYLRYLVRHKWFVFRAGLWTKAPLWRLLVHDLSKLAPSEWGPYVNWFYQDKSAWELLDESFNPDERVRYQRSLEDKFYLAWVKHFHRNDHHWQYWVVLHDDGTYSTLPIPERVMREMVADWMGAGRAIKGHWDITEWYDQHRDIHLENDTRQFIERLIVDVADQHLDHQNKKDLDKMQHVRGV